MERRRHMARNKDNSLAFEFGEMYRHGHSTMGVIKDYVKAANWWRYAAERGHNPSRLLLARCYRFGVGVVQSHETAIGIWQRAVEDGSAAAMERLALCYQHGDGLKQSNECSFYWYRRAVECGNGAACMNLSSAYKNGELGLAVDHKEASRLLQLGVERGDVCSIHNWATILETGQSIMFYSM